MAGLTGAGRGEQLGRVLSRADRLVTRVRDVLDLDDARRRIDQIPTELNGFGVDPFGADPTMLKALVPAIAAVYRGYFRAETFGIENVPDGRCMLVANHAGQIPIDGAMFGAAVLLYCNPPLLFRAMVERWVQELPVASWLFPRIGQVTGTQDNCRRLMEREECILVFPEGVRGISKTYDRRYRLEEFGTGFMQLAIENHAPIVPVAVIGSEEQAPALFNAKRIGKMLGAPAFPITPTWPLLGPMGAVPYPSKYRIHFGPPMHFRYNEDEDPATDLANKSKLVKNTLQAMLDRGVRERKHIFW